MSAGVAKKILAAAAYLEVAPTVVRVATGLPIAVPAEALRPLDAAETAAAVPLRSAGTSARRWRARWRRSAARPDRGP